MIPAVPFSAHALNESVLLQDTPEISAGILDATVTVNH